MDIIQGGADTIQGGDRLYNGASAFRRVEISFVAKDIGIPIVFIQNGGGTENLLRMITDYVYQFRGEDRDQNRGI